MYEHPLMKRFHRPGDEKRAVVIVPRASYEDRLACASTNEARSFRGLYPVECMHAEAYPLPPRKPASKTGVDRQSAFMTEERLCRFAHSRRR